MHNFLSISILSEYFYCPRSFVYQIEDYRAFQEENYFILDGRKKHQKSSEVKNFFNRKGEKVISQFYVYSRKLQIHGKLDRLEILKNNNFIAIEEKRGTIRSDKKIQFQLDAMLYCLWEMYPEKSIEGFIYFIDSRRRKKSLFSNKDLENFEKDVFSVKKALQVGEFHAKRDARCFGCMYQKICG